jgi:hypothetical protein
MGIDIAGFADTKRGLIGRRISRPRAAPPTLSGNGRCARSCPEEGNELRVGTAITRQQVNIDPPPIWWTPMLGFRAGRKVSDEHNAPGISGDLQMRGG